MSKNSFRKIFSLYVGISCLLISIIVALDNFYLGSIALSFISVVCLLFYTKGNPTHPLTILPFFFWAYSSFFVLHEIFFSKHVLPNFGTILVSGALGLLVYLLTVHYLIKAHWLSYGDRDIHANNLVARPISTILKAFIIITFLMTFIYLIYLLTGDYDSKRAIADSKDNSVIHQLSVAWTLFILFINILFARRVASGNGIPLAWYVALLTYCFLGFLIAGERNYFLLGLVCSFFVAQREGKVHSNISFMLVSFGLLVFLLPILQSLKGFLLGEQRELILSLEVILQEGFYSAGRAFHLTLEYLGDNYLGFEAIARDLMRVFNFLPWDEPPLNMTQWFNQEVRYSIGYVTRSGWGYSLLAAGYAGFGYLGVSLYSFFLGILATIYYRLSRTSGEIYILYAIFLAVAVYAMRADLANLINITVKGSIIPYIALRLGEKLGKKNAMPYEI